MIRETLVLYEHSATFHLSSVNMQSEEAIISPLSGSRCDGGEGRTGAGSGARNTHSAKCARARVRMPRTRELNERNCSG